MRLDETYGEIPGTVTTAPRSTEGSGRELIRRSHRPQAVAELPAARRRELSSPGGKRTIRCCRSELAAQETRLRARGREHRLRSRDHLGAYGRERSEQHGSDPPAPIASNVSQTSSRVIAAWELYGFASDDFYGFNLPRRGYRLGLAGRLFLVVLIIALLLILVAWPLD